MHRFTWTLGVSLACLMPACSDDESDGDAATGGTGGALGGGAGSGGSGGAGTGGTITGGAAGSPAVGGTPGTGGAGEVGCQHWPERDEECTSYPEQPRFFRCVLASPPPSCVPVALGDITALYCCP